jgi:transcription antitermination factor NusG
MSPQKKKPQKTKLFLAIYLGNLETMKNWGNLPAKERREREVAGMKAWGEWVEKNKKSIVDMGAPLGPTKRVTRRGVTAVRNDLTAYTIVKAKSQAEAAKMFKNHPHFMIFPGNAVEVMECFEIPGM